jgi:hypothetical protein
MKPDDFVAAIRQAMISEALGSYRELFQNTPREQITDGVWKAVFSGWDSLNDQQRDSVLRFVRLAIVDTISHVLGVLDNTSPLGRYRDGFVLRYGSEEKKISGDLQDVFLALEEDEPLRKEWDPS